MIFLNFNQVIYSSSPISWPSFKPLAQILFEISCWQDFMLIFSKGHNSRKGDNWDKKKNTGQLFFHEESIYEISNPSMHSSYDMACIRFRSDFIQRDITPEREITQTRKKTCVKYFYTGIHIWNFKTLACTVFDERTDTTHGQPETNMLRQLLRSWGHK